VQKNDIPASSSSAVGDRVARAAERRLERQRRSAEDEVGRLLDVTIELIERTAPAIPSVSDIVAAAGISNQTLYRTFGSKDELILAVLERGTLRVAETLRERMAAEEDPRKQVLVWIRVVLRQVSDEDLARTSRSVLGYLNQAGAAVQAGNQTELLNPITDLLAAPLRALGCDPERDGACVSDLVVGAMRRHLWNASAPSSDELEEMGRFVLRGLRAEK